MRPRIRTPRPGITPIRLPSGNVDSWPKNGEMRSKILPLELKSLRIRTMANYEKKPIGSCLAYRRKGIL